MNYEEMEKEIKENNSLVGLKVFYNDEDYTIYKKKQFITYIKKIILMDWFVV